MLALSYTDLSMVEKSIKNPAKCGQPWSEEDLCCLTDRYGLTPNKELAKYLQRSEMAMLAIAYRKLHIRATDNFYTATELANVLGIGTRHPIITWVHKNLLKGSRRYLGASGQPSPRLRCWCFVEEDIVECLRQHPWLVELRSMERHYFRSVVQEEWNRDPWYTVEQAAPLLGVKMKDPVFRYIHMGWLQVEKKPCPGSPEGVFLIRQSAIQAFLKDDPRQRHRHARQSESRKRRLSEEGRPARIGMVWNFSCPRCGQEVKIMAPPDMMGPEVKERFITVYVNGTCFHSAEVELTIPP